MGGPIWSAPIHDQEWVAAILADVKSMKDRYPAYERISAVLTTVSEVWFALKLILCSFFFCPYDSFFPFFFVSRSYLGNLDHVTYSVQIILLRIISTYFQRTFSKCLTDECAFAGIT